MLENRESSESSYQAPKSNFFESFSSKSDRLQLKHSWHKYGNLGVLIF